MNLGTGYRLKSIRGETPLPEFAKLFGVSKSTLARYEKEENYPDAVFLVRLQREFGYNPTWVVSGDGPMRYGEGSRDTESKVEIVEDQTPYALGDEFALVPRYNVQASAGGGADVHCEQVVDHLAFKRTWLKEMDLKAKHLALITTVGDSMYPTIKDGDLLLVDLRKREQIQDGIYVLRMDGSLLAKRLQNSLDGGILVKSDNSAYDNLKAEKDQVSLLEIVGRVVWTGGKI